jgi:hypothetical protein
MLRCSFSEYSYYNDEFVRTIKGSPKGRLGHTPVLCSLSAKRACSLSFYFIFANPIWGNKIPSTVAQFESLSRWVLHMYLQRRRSRGTVLCVISLILVLHCQVGLVRCFPFHRVVLLVSVGGVWIVLNKLYLAFPEYKIWSHVLALLPANYKVLNGQI